MFEELDEIILSKSSYKITNFIDFSPYARMFTELNSYAQKLRTNLERYVNKSRTYLPYQKTGDFILNPIDRERQADINLMLQDAITETRYLQKALVKMEFTYQKIVNPDSRNREKLLSINTIKLSQHQQSCLTKCSYVLYTYP